MALLWVLQWLQHIDALRFLAFYSTVCLLLSLVSWVWMGWRTRALRAERDTWVRLLAELRE